MYFGEQGSDAGLCDLSDIDKCIMERSSLFFPLRFQRQLCCCSHCYRTWKNLGPRLEAYRIIFKDQDRVGGCAQDFFMYLCISSRVFDALQSFYRAFFKVN